MRASRGGGATRLRRLGIWLVAMVVALFAGAVILLFPLLPPPELSRTSIPRGADSAVVTAGARYRAGFFRQLLLGRHYRELWTQPVKVEVLQLGEFDGGLRPTRESGG